MDRLDAMAVFVAVVEEGSLAAAARKLGHSPATVTRAVAMLETGLGQRLLHRSTRALRLTERGERQVAVYRSVLADLAEADDDSREGAQIAGRIVLTAPELFGRKMLMPVVETFLDAYPGVSARVLLLNRIVNLVEEGVDAAIRLAPLPDSSLVAVRLGEMRRLLCAAASYVARTGSPGTPGDLPKHCCLGTQDGVERELWHFTDRTSSRHRSLSMAIQPRIALNSAGAAIDAAIRGGGICRVMAYQVADDIEAGRLVPLLREFEPDPSPVHLVFHPIPRRNVAMRAFVDRATPDLRSAVAHVAQRVSRFGVPN